MAAVYQLRVSRSQISLILMLGLAALLFLSTSTPAVAAAPRLVLVYGDGLAHPVVLDDWWGNLALLLGDEQPEELADLDGRPYLELALFWGPAWDQYVRDGNPLDALRPEQANQRGRLYLGTADLPPLLAINGVRNKTTPGPVWSVRSVPAEAIQVFARHGIPTRVGAAAPARPDSLPASGGIDAAPTLAAVGLTLLVAGSALRVRPPRCRQAAWRRWTRIGRPYFSRIVSRGSMTGSARVSESRTRR